jgi:hypothetical protein
MKPNGQPHINAEIFLDHIQTVFLRTFAELHALDAFAEEVAVSLMDNCSSHIPSDLSILLTKARVCVVIFAPYRTQIFQVLKLTLFGVLKRQPRYELPFGVERAAFQFTMTVYHDFKQKIVKSNR